MKNLLSFFIVLAFLFSSIAFAQDEKTTEAEVNVPELNDFHDIIYPIWHTYYPEKDYAGLRGTLEEVNTRAEKVYSAKLPGFYQEKMDKWNKGVEKFRGAVNSFAAAVKGADDEALLKAAETMHAEYEVLVRVLHPVPKHVENFHKMLYVIYHDITPNEKWEDLKGVVTGLKTRADSITVIKLSKRFESKKEAFNAAANELVSACETLIKVVQTNEPKAMKDAVEFMHTKYLGVEKIFD